jgi:hypothetical protein
MKVPKVPPHSVFSPHKKFQWEQMKRKAWIKKWQVVLMEPLKPSEMAQKNKITIQP